MFSVFFPVVAGGAALVFATGLTAASLTPFVAGAFGLLGLGESHSRDIIVNFYLLQELEGICWHRPCV